MEHDRIAEKLKKIKALADRGVGGEKETAMRMYEELKARYEIEDEEIMLDTVSLHWFGYNGELEEDLLTQIFYKVTPLFLSHAQSIAHSFSKSST